MGTKMVLIPEQGFRTAFSLLLCCKRCALGLYWDGGSERDVPEGSAALGSQAGEAPWLCSALKVC